MIPKIAMLFIEEQIIGLHQKPIGANVILESVALQNQQKNLIELRLDELFKSGEHNIRTFPVIFAIPVSFWEDTIAYIKSHHYFNLQQDMLFFVEEPEFPTCNASGHFQLASTHKFIQTCSAGGTHVIEQIIRSGYLSKLISLKVEWLMVSNYTNIGAKIEQSIATRLVSTSYDIVAEVVRLEQFPDLNTVVIDVPFSPKRTPVLCHKIRLTHEKSKIYLNNAIYGAIGTYWIRLKSLAKCYDLSYAELLKNARSEDWKDRIKHKSDILLRIDEDSYVLNSPLSILSYDLKMLPLEVSSSRYHLIN